jgi:hypothetical protein
MKSTAIAATFDAHQLANLPSARSMWAIQAATPAVFVTRFDLGSSATGFGGLVIAASSRRKTSRQYSTSPPARRITGPPGH